MVTCIAATDLPSMPGDFNSDLVCDGFGDLTDLDGDFISDPD